MTVVILRKGSKSDYDCNINDNNETSINKNTSEAYTPSKEGDVQFEESRGESLSYIEDTDRDRSAINMAMRLKGKNPLLAKDEQMVTVRANHNIINGMKNSKFIVSIEHVNTAEVDFDCLMLESGMSKMFSMNNEGALDQNIEHPNLNSYELNMICGKPLINN